MTHDEVEILYIEDDAADVELPLAALRRHKKTNQQVVQQIVVYWLAVNQVPLPEDPPAR